MVEKLYATRDVSTPELRELYARHTLAMTVEDLHDKGDIAAELAWRDARIVELETWRHLADELLQKLWRSFRNDASRVQGATECLGVFSLAGAIAHETAELWARRFRECPGHDDEGGRSWCAYCGDMPQATSPFDPDADGDKFTREVLRRG